MTATNKDVLLQSIKTIKNLKKKLAFYEQKQSSDIAIIGVGCRFPGGVTDLSSYWDLLSVGRSGVVEVGADRWSNRQFVDPDYDATGKLVTPYAGLLDSIYDFDAEFFGLSAIEAENLDPQQRILLEQSWLALEDAGYDIQSLRGSDTGVFVGIGSQDYGMALSAEVKHANAYVASGNSPSMAAGRLSYFYDFSGPTLSIDTACSSSLVAVHEACRRLNQQDCELALAAGVNAILTPHAGVNFSRARMLTTEQDCHVFDARAKGYVRGEGCGVVVLKRLADAQRDGDRIHAVIKSVAINHDGHSSGLTVPNGSAQEAVIRSALQQADLSPGDISYIEAHGTGTSLGDPIEARALAAVFTPARNSETPLQVGGVKANLGHLEAAAGIASLIKAALVVGQAKAPPQLGFEQLNPKIDWDSQIFKVARKPCLLKGEGHQSICAGISNFGFSGTNVHAIVAAAPVTPVVEFNEDIRDSSEQEVILALSAKTPQALSQHVANVVSYLENQSPDSLQALSYTSTLRRMALTERIAVSGSSASELSHNLQAALHDRVSPYRSRLVLSVSRHDDLTQLQDLISSMPLTEMSLTELSDEKSSQDVRCAHLHQQLLALLGLYGVYPDQVLVEGIEPAYIRAWLAGTATPTTLPYFSSEHGDNALVLLDADTSQIRVSSAELPEVLAQTLVLTQKQMLAQGAVTFSTLKNSQCQMLSDRKSLFPVLAALFTAGVDVDWSPVYAEKHPLVADFPKRSFEQKTFRSPCINEMLQRNSKSEGSPLHPLVYHKLMQPNGMHAYELDVSVAWLDFIDQHRVQGRRFLPASLLIDLMRHVGGDALNLRLAQLSKVHFYQPVDIDLAEREYVLQVQQMQGTGLEQEVEAVLWSRVTEAVSGSWTRHASARCLPPSASTTSTLSLGEAVQSDLADGTCVDDSWQKQDVAVLYTQHRAGGVALGENFRCVKSLRVKGQFLTGEISLDASQKLDPMTSMTILLDACFQISGGLPNADTQVHLLASLGQVSLVAELPNVLRVQMEHKSSPEGRCFDVKIFNIEGRVLGHLTEVFFKRLPNSQTESSKSSGSVGGVIPLNCFYKQQWQAAEWQKAVAVKAELLPLTKLLQRSDSMLAWVDRFDLARYNSYREQIEQACLKLIDDTLRDLGRGLDTTAPEAMIQWGIHSTQHKLFAHLFRTLDSHEVQRQGEYSVPNMDLAQLLESYPQYQSETQFMQRCTAALSDVLLGKQDPLDVLFRDTSMAGSNAVYLDSPISRVLNSQLAQIAAVLAEGRSLRILEIGAGTGGTTGSVLEKLRDFPIEVYCFTDISPMFLDRAKGLFQEHDFMEYRILDIESSVASQSFEPGSYDLVIASNVLHATRSIEQTLHHVRGLLVPQGYLLLRECIAPQLSADLSFGMTEGWWRFSDIELRPDYAVIGTEQWQQQLLKQEFSEVCSMVPHPLSAEALIVAQLSEHSVHERWLLIHDDLENVWEEQLEQRGVMCCSLSWSEVIEGMKIPGDLVFDYVICFPQLPEDAVADPVSAATRQSESLIMLCRHLLGKDENRQMRLWCVTTQAEKVLATDDLAGLAQSVMTGVVKCAALEYPGRIGGVVDLERQQGADHIETIDRLLTHIRQPGGLRYLSIRKGQPYTLELLPQRSNQSAENAAGEEQVLLYAGTVLITGGFGGIGSAIARVLAPQVKTLVLVSRTIEGVFQQALLQELKSSGIKIITIAADLAIPAQVDAVFEQLEKDHIYIEHLIHTAGIGGDRLISDSQPGDLTDVVSSKLASTWYLHQGAPKELKSFQVLSSMVGLWGAKGKTHYVLANHFADRVVQLRRGQGLPASVVQLGPVDSGMLNEAGKEAAQRVGVHSFDVHQLAELLTTALPSPESALLDINWSHFKPIYRDTWLESYFAQVGSEEVDRPKESHQHNKDIFLQQYHALSSAQRGKFIEAQLFIILRQVLGMSGELDRYLDTGFHDLGMDSLLTMSFAEKVAALTSVAVSAVDIFDNANLARLSQWLSVQLTQHFQATSLDVPGVTLKKDEVQNTQQQDREAGKVSIEQIEEELKAMQTELEDV